MSPRTFTAPRPETTVDWRHGAICRDVEDVELFFPVGEEESGPVALQIQQAKAVCFRCPVMQQCAQWALDTQQEDGVWGGLSAKQRRNIHRQAARNAAKATAPLPAIEHGTPRGARQHYKRGEQACEACHRALRDYANAQRREARRAAGGGKKPTFKPIEHGTRAGAQMHRRRNDPICADCWNAERVYKAERRRARKEAVAA